jgi:hypothetical protein
MHHYSWPFRMMWGVSLCVCVCVYHCLYETTCALPFYLLVNGKIGRWKNNKNIIGKLERKYPTIRKKNFTFSYSFACEYENVKYIYI